jgi:hypothetical protein
MNELIPIPAGRLAVRAPRGIAVLRSLPPARTPPAASSNSSPPPSATIRNKNTRMAYYRAVTDFFTWVERHKIGQLVDIEPLHVAAYVETLQASFAKPTVKQYLAAIRMCFD